MAGHRRSSVTRRKRLNLAKAQSLRKVLSIVPSQVDNPSNVLRKDAGFRSRRYFVSPMHCRGSGKYGVTPLQRGHEKKAPKPCEGSKPSQGSVNRAPQVDNPSNVLRKDADVRSRRYFASPVHCRRSGKYGGTPKKRGHEKKLLYQKKLYNILQR